MKEDSVMKEDIKKPMNFEEQYGNSGNFSYEENGFTYEFKLGRKKILWKDIEKLIAYKVDLITTDEICMKIVVNDFEMTITEDTPGWNLFVEITKSVFPSVPERWHNSIIQPPFSSNSIVLYER